MKFPHRRSVFERKTIEEMCRPNLSPVVEERTFRDEETGAEIDVTRHQDNTITVVAERFDLTDVEKP